MSDALFFHATADVATELGRQRHFHSQVAARPAYDTDLSDLEWRRIEPVICPDQTSIRSRSYARREIVNAIFYHESVGGVWRLLPEVFPPWRSVIRLSQIWRSDGTWARVGRLLGRGGEIQVHGQYLLL